MTKAVAFLVVVQLLSSAACARVESISSKASPTGERAISTEVETLPALKADRNAVSVSGVSAGAYMATQLQVAFSASIMGLGSVAGGPWNCANGLVWMALGRCMDTPSEIDPAVVIDQAKTSAKLKEIDPVKNLRRARVYLFNSPVDKVIPPPIGEKTLSFFSAFVDSQNLKTETSIASGHGLPTLDFGGPCSNQGTPFLNNCAADIAGDLLKFIYGSRVSKRASYDQSALMIFDQTEFGSELAGLDETGWAYIPQPCRVSGTQCPVHVALHGCQQGGESVKDVFAVHAGYNEWAQGSNLIVLYPQIRKSYVNPNGCFDWWGYTGADYATKNGSQMRAIKAMIDRVSGS